MSENNYGAEIATSKETIKGTWEWDGEEYDLITKDTTKGTLDLIGEYMEVAQTVENAEGEDDIPEGLGSDLDDFPWDHDHGSDADMVEIVVGEKLVKPEVDVNEVPMRKIRALFEGMLEAWNAGETVKDAKGQMPVDNPNTASPSVPSKR